jgi:hypothetical protein
MFASDDERLPHEELDEYEEEEVTRQLGLPFSYLNNSKKRFSKNQLPDSVHHVGNKKVKKGKPLKGKVLPRMSLGKKPPPFTDASGELIGMLSSP